MLIVFQMLWIFRIEKDQFYENVYIISVTFTAMKHLPFPIGMKVRFIPDSRLHPSQTKADKSNQTQININCTRQKTRRFSSTITLVYDFFRYSHVKKLSVVSRFAPRIESYAYFFSSTVVAHLKDITWSKSLSKMVPNKNDCPNHCR